MARGILTTRAQTVTIVLAFVQEPVRHIISEAVHTSSLRAGRRHSLEQPGAFQCDPGFAGAMAGPGGEEGSSGLDSPLFDRSPDPVRSVS